MEEKISAARQSKMQVVADIKAKIENSKSVVIVSYSGLTVAQDTELRNEFRKAGVEYKVLKNTLIKRAMDELGHTQFDEALNGTTSVAFAADEVAAAKIVTEATKKYDGKISAKCGLADGEYVDANGVKALAALPPKEVLVAKMLGSLNSPIAGLAGVLSATLRSLVYAINAVKDKQAQA